MKTNDFEKRLQALDQLALAIASIRIENWKLIAEYNKVADHMLRLKTEAEQHFGGPIASDEVLEKKVCDFLNNLELRNSIKPKSLQKHTKRLSGTMKLSVLIAMLRDFNSQGRDRVTLEDISDWTTLANRGEKQQILNDMGIGRVEVASTQFFQTKIAGNVVKLYPDEVYESKSAPFKGHFIVKPWLQWLVANQAELEKGQPIPVSKKQR